jgi:hypothetical protein
MFIMAQIWRTKKKTGVHLERDFDENIAAADNSNNVNGSQYKICKI